MHTLYSCIFKKNENRISILNPSLCNALVCHGTQGETYFATVVWRQRYPAFVFTYSFSYITSSWMARMPLLKICCNPFLFISCISFQTVSPISHHCPELSVYIREETFLLQHEIASLEKVSTKLEQEIQEVNAMKGQYLTSLCMSLFRCINE